MHLKIQMITKISNNFKNIITHKKTSKVQSWNVYWIFFKNNFFVTSFIKVHWRHLTKTSVHISSFLQSDNFILSRLFNLYWNSFFQIEDLDFLRKLFKNCGKKFARKSYRILICIKTMDRKVSENSIFHAQVSVPVLWKKLKF